AARQGKTIFAAPREIDLTTKINCLYKHFIIYFMVKAMQRILSKGFALACSRRRLYRLLLIFYMSFQKV
ncbi:MAG: hypothetical protein FWC17_03560, partial [Treponema sp.]|nr:hypothetical protein [Treponema sp.]